MPTLDYLPWLQPDDYAARPWVRDGAQELTYAQFADRVEAVAEQFAEEGVRSGDVVGIMMRNRVELLIAIVAAWRLRAAATPLNPAFTANEAGYQLDDAAAAVVVVDGISLDGRRTIDVADLRREPARTLPAPTTGADDLAMLIYTSGSTGRPKGVMLEHRNIESLTGSLIELNELGVDDHCLLFLPLFHANALFVSFLMPYRSGAQLSILPKFTVDGFVDAVARWRPTFFSGVPAIYAMLVAHAADADLSSVKYAYCGAAPASQELLVAAETTLGFPLLEGYGLTECTCVATTNPMNGQRKVGTVGPAIPGTRVEVVDPDGAILPHGERGEVVIKGGNVMAGYLGRPEATADTVRDGWLHTGDIGILDADGYLRIVDRIKDMIIRGGENIYPKEIENVLAGCAGVLEVAVVGAPDAVLGEVPVAFVAPYPGVEIDVEELRATCYDHLAKFKVPVAFHVLDVIPKNPVGKIDKPTLRTRQELTGTLAGTQKGS
ncbi:long-chain fatty acid--CoA ligase [Gordonia sp. TBRC 11910]|uniref:Long-chain fatty acid--CoA ligase n=1 Tax=Gordonia asplenii TaxID=2725283 RepID=A0A848KYX6_9ACTN|nr:AMP-binding protein [Gordonia asplenii]NMO03422.1 long-chain fatty acid--CoA ligase [Gordonia asplenii]